MMSGSRGVKSFVSEAEVEEVRKKRQDEWEKVRQPDDPIERPEEVNDTRTLYEKLQEQKDKKQEEWEEQHKFKNMIRGLESEETEFLDQVAKQQHEVKKRIYDEEDKELKDFRSAVSDLQDASVNNTKPAVKKSAQLPGKKSQMDLIGGGIKRRKSSSSSDTTPEKKPKREEKKNTENNQTDAQSNPTTSTNNTSLPTYSSSDDEDKIKSEPHRKVYIPRCRADRRGANLRQTLTIPGMGIYSDSSDSESSSSDSEILTSGSVVRYR